MNSVLINFPTNIGDVIMALPVLDRVRSNYPQAKITAIASPRTKEFLLKNTLIDEVITFDKCWKPIHKMRFSLHLRGKYEAMVDLKNSFLPVLLGVKVHSPFIRRFSNKVHIVDKYLALVSSMAPHPPKIKSDFLLEKDRIKHWDALGLNKALFIACTSLSQIKQYPLRHLRKVVEHFGGRCQLVIIGDKADRGFYKDILQYKGVIDLVGETFMWDVFYLLKNYAGALLGVDSSITHMASYLDVAVVALFGPTSYERSCPRSSGSIVLRRQELSCIPCETAHCLYHNECMDIEPGQVIKAITTILSYA